MPKSQAARARDAPIERDRRDAAILAAVDEKVKKDKDGQELASLDAQAVAEGRIVWLEQQLARQRGGTP